MYDINLCYKLILDALLTDHPLEYMANNIHTCGKIELIFIAESGKILGDSRKRFRKSRYITPKDYKLFFDISDDASDDASEEKKTVTYVQAENYTIGYIVQLHQGEKEHAVELGNVLAQSMTESFRKQALFLNRPLADYLRGRVAFTDEERPLAHKWLKEDREYVEILLRRDLADVKDVVAQNNSFWKQFFVYGEEEYFTIVLYGFSEKQKKSLSKNLDNIHVSGCISEVFKDAAFLKNKQELLKQMFRLKKVRQTGKLQRERDCYVQIMFSVTYPLIEDAGLTDYRIEDLIAKDRINNTDLYETLRTYLLCANNVTDTAERLHIHRNTLMYRLRQIKESMNTDIDDQDVARELLAFILMYDIGR